jgi:hypothetical protein
MAEKLTDEEIVRRLKAKNYIHVVTSITEAIETKKGKRWDQIRRALEYLFPPVTEPVEVHLYGWRAERLFREWGGLPSRGYLPRFKDTDDATFLGRVVVVPVGHDGEDPDPVLYVEGGNYSAGEEWIKIEGIKKW